MEKTKQTKTRQHSDDTQISRPDLRFASRESSEPTRKSGRSHTKKAHTKITRIASDTIGISPPCLRKYAQNELASLWPEQKGVKSCATVKSSNKIARDESLCREMSPFFSVQPHMALARSLSKPESQLHIYKFSELKQWQNHHIDKVHQK